MVIKSLFFNLRINKSLLYAGYSMTKLNQTRISNISTINLIINYNKYLFNQTSKLYSTAIDFKDTINSEEDGQTINYLKEIGFNDNELNEILLKFPSIGQRNIFDIKKTIAFLDSKSLASMKNLSKYPWLLYLPSEIVISKLSIICKQNLLSSHDENKYCQVFALLLIPEQNLDYYLKRIKNPKVTLFQDLNDRLEYFGRELDLCYEEFCDLICSDNFSKFLPLIKFDLKRLTNILILLKTAGVTNEDIKKDNWIFRHNYVEMKRRIRILQRKKYPIKLWTLRTTEEFFKNYLIRCKDELRFLRKHNNNVIDFLSFHLKCNRNTIMLVNSDYPNLISISPQKLLNVISFLYKAGFTSQEIIGCPRIFFHDLETIKYRLFRLNSLNYKSISLKKLVITNEKFNYLLEQIMLKTNNL